MAILNPFPCDGRDPLGPLSIWQGFLVKFQWSPLKKFNPDRKFQSWLEIINPQSKISISTENFNPGVSLTGLSWCTEKGPIKNCNPRSIARNFQSRRPRSNFLNPRALWVRGLGHPFPGLLLPWSSRNLLCCYSSCCLEALGLTVLWGSFLCAQKARSEWYSLEGASSHNSRCLGAFHQSTSRTAQTRVHVVRSQHFSNVPSMK